MFWYGPVVQLLTKVYYFLLLLNRSTEYQHTGWLITFPIYLLYAFFVDVMCLRIMFMQSRCDQTKLNCSELFLQGGATSWFIIFFSLSYPPSDVSDCDSLCPSHTRSKTCGETIRRADSSQTQPNVMYDEQQIEQAHTHTYKLCLGGTCYRLNCYYYLDLIISSLRWGWEFLVKMFEPLRAYTQLFSVRVRD